MNLFDHVKQLHDSELYQDLSQLASVVITLCDNSTDVELLTLQQRYQCMVYYGNALYNMSQYLKAEDTYKKAIILRKGLNKSKVKGGPPCHMELTSEVEVKYKMYQCLLQQKQYKEAMSVLEGISSRQRNPKIHLALAKLYLRAGMDRSAITSYKEVIRVCPLALEALNGLLGLGVKGSDVATLVINGLPHGTPNDWLSMWIKGQAHLSSREFSSAVATFQLMDTKAYLKDNVLLVNSLAEALFYDGRYSGALQAFQRVHALDPLQVKNMDLYSYLLSKEEKVKDLQRLSQRLMKITEYAPESWISMGYFSMVTHKESRTRTVYFAQKANNLDSFNIEAYLLKGSALLELKKSQDASLHFQEALRLAPHRYEAYLGLINCYMASHRTREALSWAGKAIKILGNNARTLTLYASVLSKEPTMTAKAKPYLEKAMKMDPNFLEPVYIMADILTREHQYDKGIELLRKQLQTQSTCRLHRTLGDFLGLTNEHLEAIDQYSIALSLDPTNSRAREGMERVEKQSDMGLMGLSLENSYDVDDIEGSDNDGDFDNSNSDVESTWSETEYT
ncbi:anaphase-promoting complex subunit 7-like [Ylistrum balloti]|uniref:anaphase-promoting complex subunit 7-like n=1 Tax=Ylistrum balloti TaxID=509963 RepID=UPI002905AA63|nr:anaphase-promoting complex subunit 7-like [Ylistrum balloti]